KTFLHIDRHTMQRPAGHIARDGLIRLSGALKRTFAELIDVCVEFRLKLVDPAERKLRQLDRRDLSAMNRSRRIESGAKNRIKHRLCLLWVALQCQMSNVPCRMSNLLDQLTRRPNWVSWSSGQVHLTFDIGRLTFDI